MSGLLLGPYVLGMSSTEIRSCLVPPAMPTSPAPDPDLDPTESVPDPVADSKCSRCDHHGRFSDRSNCWDPRAPSSV